MESLRNANTMMGARRALRILALEARRLPDDNDMESDEGGREGRVTVCSHIIANNIHIRI